MEAIINRHLAIHDDPISLTLDSEARWRSFRLGDRQFRRLVNGDVVEIVNDIPLDLGSNIIQGLYAVISHNLEVLSAKSVSGQIPSDSCNVRDPSLQLDIFQKAIDFTKSDINQFRQLYAEAYPESISMLPPDRYRDLVLLPATGCPRSGSCSFCTLYPNARFHVFNHEEFDEHIDKVIQLFGSAIFEKTGIFLGSASALSLSQKRLITILSKIKNRLGSFNRGISSFLDPYHAPIRDQAQYEELGNLGLKQVTIGLESGSGLLRKTWGKSSDLTLLESTIKILKKSGIQVALTILTAFNKKIDFLDHVTDTITFIKSLPLSQQDIIYISPLHPSPISRVAMDDQIGSLKYQLRNVTSARVVPYFVNKFRYYA